MNAITHYPTSILLFHSPYPFCCSRSLHCSLWSTLTLVPLWSGGPEKQIQRPATECKDHITVLKFSSLFLDFLPSLHFNPPTRLPSSEGIGRSLNSESVKSEGCVTPAVHVKQLDYWSTVYDIFQITLTISLLPPSTMWSTSAWLRFRHCWFQTVSQLGITQTRGVYMLKIWTQPHTTLIQFLMFRSQYPFCCSGCSPWPSLESGAFRSGGPKKQIHVSTSSQT